MIEFEKCSNVDCFFYPIGCPCAYEPELCEYYPEGYIVEEDA